MFLYVPPLQMFSDALHNLFRKITNQNFFILTLVVGAPALQLLALRQPTTH